jgi:hypothetical protein
VLSEYWVALLGHDRAWLRRFDSSRTMLATWLGVLAWDVANKHLRRLRRWQAGMPADDLDLDHEPWHDRGARWIATMNAIEPDEPVRLDRFKWR